MFRDILVIFDDQKACPDALEYGREFAVRMDARVTFLVLVSMSFSGRTFLGSKRNALKHMESCAAELLSRSSEAFVRHGIEVSSAYKVGDPAQELVKFLADHPPFQAIIWGSSPELPGKGHWFGRASGNLECPVLTVSKREPSG